MKEEYRKIEEFNGIYSISNLGNVRRSQCFINKDGTLRGRNPMLMKKRLSLGSEVVTLVDLSGKAHRRTILSLMKNTFPELKFESPEIVIPRTNKKKQVLQYSFAMVLVNKFKSLREASITTNVNIAQISNCCNGKADRAGGFIFKWADKEITKIKNK